MKVVEVDDKKDQHPVFCNDLPDGRNHFPNSYTNIYLSKIQLWKW